MTPISIEQRPLVPFVLSLLAGLWMLGTGRMMYGMASMMDYMHGGGFTDDAGSWMWGHGMMRGVGMGLWMPWFGPIAGVIVLVGAALLYNRPGQARKWGLVIVIVSAVDVLIGMGGLIAGALGVIGGALAMSWTAEAET